MGRANCRVKTIDFASRMADTDVRKEERNMTTKTHATPHALTSIAYTTGALSYCRRYVASKNLRSNQIDVTCEKCRAALEPKV